MGLFDGLRGGFEKLERRGDGALERGRPLEAVQHFRDALRRAAPKDPRAADRLQGKVTAARLAFLEGKLVEAQELAADDLLAEALEAVQIADQHLAADDTALRARSAALARDIESRMAAREPLAEPADPTGARRADLPADAAGQQAQPADDEEPGEAAEPADLELLAAGEGFEQFLGALPEEDRERAAAGGIDFRRGFVALQLGRMAEARAAFERAARAAPEDALVREQLGIALDALGQAREARREYEAALAREPGRPAARVALAGIASGVRPAGGVQPFSLWVKAAAEAQLAGADPSKGLALLEEGRRLDETRSGAYLAAAAELCVAAGRPAQAQPFLERAHAAGGANPAVLKHLEAVGREMSGDPEGAEAAHEEAVRLGGNALFFRAEFAEFALRQRRALKEAQQYIFDTCLGCQATAPSPEDLDYYGFLLTRLQHARGELQEALAGVDRLLAQGPPPALESALRQVRDRITEDIAARGRDVRRPDPDGSGPGPTSGP
jgi:tetratricopeptide (TPR) repeat protein